MFFDKAEDDPSSENQSQQKKMAPLYLGDAVYLQSDPEDPSRLILTTNSHKLIAADAVIYLEPEIAITLARLIGSYFGGKTE